MLSPDWLRLPNLINSQVKVAYQSTAHAPFLPLALECPRQHFLSFLGYLTETLLSLPSAAATNPSPFPIPANPAAVTAAGPATSAFLRFLPLTPLPSYTSNPGAIALLHC